MKNVDQEKMKFLLEQNYNIKTQLKVFLVAIFGGKKSVKEPILYCVPGCIIISWSFDIPI